MSIKSFCPYTRIPPPPPPRKSVNFEDFLLICTVSPHFGRFSGWGGGKPNFADKNFVDTQTFLKYDRAKVPPHNGNDPRPPLVV